MKYERLVQGWFYEELPLSQQAKKLGLTRHAFGKVVETLVKAGKLETSAARKQREAKQAQEKAGRAKLRAARARRRELQARLRPST